MILLNQKQNKFRVFLYKIPRISAILLIVLISLIWVFLNAFLNEASASSLYFEPQETVIGTEGEFLVAVNVSAENSVNAFNVAISISPEIVPDDISDGNSIINLWLDKPNWDENSRLLTFSGIIPGGFKGEDAPLLIVKLRAVGKGEAVLNFDHGQTKVYLHTPDGIEDTLDLASLHIPIVQGKKNIPVNLPDTDPPEPFTPIITRDPSVFAGKWFLVFATQDKASGLFRYEVAEKRGKLVKDYSKLSWRIAESPFELRDQELKSYVYIKAIDKAGNERIVNLPPQKPLAWYEKKLIFEIIIIFVIIILIIVILLWKKSRRKKSH